MTVSFPAAVAACVALTAVGAALGDELSSPVTVIVCGGVALLAAAVVHRSARRSGSSSRAAALMALVTVLSVGFYVLALFVGLLMSFGFSEM